MHPEDGLVSGGRHRALLAAFLWISLSGQALGLDQSVPRVGGDISRDLLGDGTGVVIGVIDSGIDSTHPALAGLDSQGQPRLVAEANFVRTELDLTPDDVYGHGTAVAGVALSADALLTGLAPDARYVNARVLDRNNTFQSSDWVIDGIGFAIESGADILNLSLNTSNSNSNGMARLDLVADWVAYEMEIPVSACAGNISQAVGGETTPRAPGGAYNVLSVGRTTMNFGANYGQVDVDSAHGTTTNGRAKPDLVAPGNGITTLSDDWELNEATTDDYRVQSGCSFATPHVSGMLAQQMEYGRANGLSVHPLVLRSTLLNSAEKVYDRNGNPWQPNATTLAGDEWNVLSPLDTDSGAGQIDGAALAAQYSAGQFGPGEIAATGWDLNVIEGESDLDYTLGIPLEPGKLIAATLTWARHIRRIDLNGNDRIDSGDSFIATEALDNLDLTLLRDGLPIVASMSTVDNLEHLYWRIQDAGIYTLRVSRQDVLNSGDSEQYSLAWNVSVDDPVIGDTNGDFRVDLTDLNNLRNNFGATGLGVLGDTYPYDGIVGLDDLNRVRNNFGFTAPFLSVPEPGSLALALVSIAAIWRSARR